MTRMDRRALFASGSAAALLAAVGVSAQAAPTRGGALRAALSGGDRGETLLDRPGGAFLQAVRVAVFESLTEVAADGTLQPALATGWRSTDAGRVWFFDLREGVRFHDGSLLTGEDAIVSLQAHGLVADFDAGRVRVQLDVPDRGFPFRLAQEGMFIFRADELAKGSLRSGTGLYRMKRFDPGRGFMGVRVPSHRKDGSAGWFDTVEFIALSDETVRAEAVRDGIVDIADLTTGHGLERLEEVALLNDGPQIRAAVRSQITRPARSGRPPLDDMRFAERWWQVV